MLIAVGARTGLKRTDTGNFVNVSLFDDILIIKSKKFGYNNTRYRNKTYICIVIKNKMSGKP